jgi:hypothetical protein
VVPVGAGDILEIGDIFRQIKKSGFFLFLLKTSELASSHEFLRLLRDFRKKTDDEHTTFRR